MKIAEILIESHHDLINFVGQYPSIETIDEDKSLVNYNYKKANKLHDTTKIDPKQKNLTNTLLNHTIHSRNVNDFLHKHYSNQPNNAKDIAYYKKHIGLLDKLLVNHKLSIPITVYTGIPQSPEVAWKKYKVDRKKPIRLHLPAFTSTTTSLYIAKSFANLHSTNKNKHILMITIPAGTPGGSVTKFSQYPGEGEILLPRGLDIEVNPKPVIIKDNVYVWHTKVIGHNPIEIT
jgi:hypothetical protein